MCTHLRIAASPKAYADKNQRSFSLIFNFVDIGDSQIDINLLSKYLKPVS